MAAYTSSSSRDVRHLITLGLADDPVSQPLTYPGAMPADSGLLVDQWFLRISDHDDRRIRHWMVEFDGWEPPAEGDARDRARMDEVLHELGQAPIGDRHATLAVGSNASPGQLRRKFTTRSVPVVIPMVTATVHGIVPGVSAHISKAGYIAATPVAAPGGASALFVLWLDDNQLAALDTTEPNYRRVLLPRQRFPITLPNGATLDACHIYMSKHGCLTDPSGTPRLLTDQPALLTSLLDDSKELRRLCGQTPDEFITRAQDPQIRDQARNLFWQEGMVCNQPELADLQSG